MSKPRELLDLPPLPALPALPALHFLGLPTMTAAEVGALFGEGSEPHLIALGLENPHPSVCRECGRAAPPTDNFWCGACRERERRFTALYIAFSTVARCIDFVETFGAALFETRNDGQYGSELDALEHSFRVARELFIRRVDLLLFDSEDE